MPHVDSPELFGPTVLSLSLCSPCVMRFERESQERRLLLPARSLLVMAGELRYDWTHSISKGAVDETEDGTAVPRGRRISLTFRSVV